MEPEVSRQTMMGPRVALGRTSVRASTRVVSSTHPARSYVSSVRSANLALSRSCMGRGPASREASEGTMRERSPERVSPRVSLGSKVDRTTPIGRRGASACAGARRSGPLPEPRPSSRMRSRSSLRSASFLRSASSSSHPLCCHSPLARSKPSGPSISWSSPLNAFSAVSRLSMAGSHCSLKSSISFSAISFARSSVMPCFSCSWPFSLC
mmetsp:Transcript_36973/g.80545  ORF Transcript_36973/g.80545 Transcript_36973/m.80545 type:complete len:210 (-) Transcript_36973:1126-1755(-)